MSSESKSSKEKKGFISKILERLDKGLEKKSKNTSCCCKENKEKGKSCC